MKEVVVKYAILNSGKVAGIEIIELLIAFEDKLMSISETNCQ